LRSTRPREVEHLEGPLHGTFTCVKNQSIFEEIEFKNETKRLIITFGLYKLFSRQNSNFQKPEGPHQIGRVFQKKIPVHRKIEAGEHHHNTKEKMDHCFMCNR
jgi:hypothetical protein